MRFDDDPRGAPPACPAPGLPAGWRLVEHRGAAAHPAAVDFLTAQGPSGFAAGALLDGLRHPPPSRRPDGPVVAAVIGPEGACQAVVVRRAGRAVACAPLPDAWPAVLGVIRAWLPGLDRLGLPVSLADRLTADSPEVLAGADGYSVWLTRLQRPCRPRRPLPPARPARVSDAAAVQAITRHVPWMRDDDLDRWRERLRWERGWLAELDGRPVAVARWTHSFAGAVEVGGVACDPAARRRGAATAAVVAAAQAGVRARRTVLLSYGDPELGPLYHDLGFEHVGRHRFLAWPEGA